MHNVLGSRRLVAIAWAAVVSLAAAVACADPPASAPSLPPAPAPIGSLHRDASGHIVVDAPLPSTPVAEPTRPSSQLAKPVKARDAPPAVSPSAAGPARLLARPNVSQPQKAGDIVGFAIVNGGAKDIADAVVTFGQVFAAGDLPANLSLTARIGERAVPAQIDVKTRYQDGSVCHGIVSVRIPGVAAGRRVDVILARAPAAAPAPPLTLRADAAPALLIELALRDGPSAGVHGSLTLASLLADGGKGTSGKPWLDGSLAVEKRLRAPLAGGIAAQFDVRMTADGRTRVDLTVAYDGAYTVPMRSVHYDVRIAADQHEYVSRTNLKHNHHADWHLVMQPEDVTALQVVYDVPYLIRTRAVPALDTSIGIDAATVADDYKRLQSSDHGPMGSALDTRYMPQGGQTDGEDVGLITNWQAKYLLSQDARAMAVMLANADAGGSIPWHFRDEATGRPITIERRPGVRISENGPGDGRDALPETFDPQDTGWEPDTAHQPALFYLPYLLTGSRYYLDELQFQAAYDLAFYHPQFRRGAEGLFDTQGEEQVRGVAWVIRTLGDAAFISPDDDPLKAYFETRLSANLHFQVKKFVTDRYMRATGELEGWYSGDRVAGAVVAPWQQDFLAMSYGYLLQRGFTEAGTMLKWMANFEAGRFLNGASGYNPLFGAAYHINMAGKDGRALYGMWADAFAANFGIKTTPGDIMESGNPASAGAYWGTARGALASIITATQSPYAIEAYGYVLRQTHRTGLVAAYGSVPKWAIMPRLNNDQYLMIADMQIEDSDRDVTLSAGERNALLSAGSGNDTLHGGSGVTLIFGGSGRNTIVAGAGDAYVYAGSGASIIVNGQGNNYLKAGRGPDVFRFIASESGHDVIAGFKVGIDRLEIGANLNGNGLASADAVVGAMTTDAHGNAMIRLSQHDDIVLLGVARDRISAGDVRIVTSAGASQAQ